jgi:SAM-dependent methyltransferase
VFVRCDSCGSIFQTLSQEEFDQLHVEVFSDESFVDGVTDALGAQPDRRTWGELEPLLPGSSYLEIGPGSGHLLAAAHESGREVAAVESSPVHRDFIRRIWGLDAVHPSLSSLPPDARFDGIVAMNTLEHIYSIGPFLDDICARLSPQGGFVLSTVNPAAMSAKLVRTYWSMCKPPDHVSFPSAAGLRAASAAAGLSVDRIWYGELPLETPLSVLVAARDFLRHHAPRIPGVDRDDGRPAGSPASPGAGLGSRAMGLVFKYGRGVDPTSWALSKLHMATMIKARLVRAEP